MANQGNGPEGKKPYEKPAFRFERVFETMALSCGKMPDHPGRVPSEPEGFVSRTMLVRSVIHAETEFCKCDLAWEVLQRFGQLHVRVTGASMLPAIWPGDVVTIRSSQLTDVSPGDLVLFHRDRRFFVHRVLEMSGNSLLTRGDSVLGPDPPVSPDELLGRVVSITGAGGTRAPSQLGAAGYLVAQAVRRSTLVCNMLLRLHASYRQLLRTAPVTAVFRREAVWSN